MEYIALHAIRQVTTSEREDGVEDIIKLSKELPIGYRIISNDLYEGLMKKVLNINKED